MPLQLAHHCTFESVFRPVCQSCLAIRIVEFSPVAKQIAIERSLDQSSGVLTVSDANSVTQLIQQLEDGDSLAAKQIWDRFILVTGPAPTVKLPPRSRRLSSRCSLPRLLFPFC